MGLFGSTGPLDSKLSSVLIGGTPADLKKIGKAQGAILKTLRPDEKLLFVVAQGEKYDGAWIFTDQRLLTVVDKEIMHDLPLARIAEVELRSVPEGKRDTSWVCRVIWSGGPLMSVSSSYVNDSGHLYLIRLNQEDEMKQVLALLNGQVAEANRA